MSGTILICAGLDGIETEDGEEEHYQLPSHEAVSKDQGTDQAGEMKRKDRRVNRKRGRCSM